MKRAIARLILLVLASGLGCAPVLAQSNPTPIPSYDSMTGIGRSYGGSSPSGPGTLYPNMRTYSTSNAIAGKLINIDIGASNALANSTVYTNTVCLGFPCVLMQCYICASVAPIGGTNTVTVTKDGSTNMLASSSFNPTTLANNVGTSVPISTTASAVTLGATDTITVTWTSGVQSTAAVAPSVNLLVSPISDF
jgi:hypothetical protein